MLITNPTGNLTVQKYATLKGWQTAQTSSANYTAGSLQIESKTTRYEQTGPWNSNAPWIKQENSYDNYSATVGLGSYHQAPATGAYGNLLQQVTTSSNAPKTTQKWTYYTTNTTVNNTVYYNVHGNVAHRKLVDASGHIWACSDTVYDEGVASGVPQPAAGWPTTQKTYGDCTNPAATTLKSYSGYDHNGIPLPPLMLSE